MSTGLRNVLRTGLAATLAGVLAGPVVALIHDLPPRHPGPAVSWTLAALTVAVLSVAAGRPAARLLAARAGLRRTTAVAVGAALGTAPIATPLLRLLRAPTSPVAQLAWTLGEEDNAQIIGLAREVIMDGPGGGVLADQYGTGFVVAATTLMRMTGTPDPTLDPRLLAIHAFTLSTLLAVLTIAIAVAVAIVTTIEADRAPRLPGLVGLAVATGGAVVAALGVAVVLPMRTGFLTFVWGIAWVALGSALLPLLVRPAPAPLLAAGGVHVLATTLLAVRSWPFLGAAAVPALVLVASRMPLRPALGFVRRHPVVVALGALATAGGAAVFLWNSALGEVLSYGLEALTISASGIAFDARLGAAAAGATVVMAVLLAPRGWRAAAAVAGPAGAGLASWLALEAASLALTGGELNYGGAKLLYGVVAVATITAVPVALTAWAGRRGGRSVQVALASGGVAALLAVSATVGTVTDWAPRLAPSTPPHAVAMIEAIERTTPELPVRCRPRPGTVVTAASRWAAYFCVRWVEDALNGADRSRGYRSDYLEAPEGTFDPIVAEATAAGHYGFAYVMDLGPGWFGWDGRS